jgi:hypothetical protein
VHERERSAGTHKAIRSKTFMTCCPLLERLRERVLYVAIVSQWQSASDKDWALALANEAVIRPLTDQPEVTEELVVTASDESGLSARRKIPNGGGRVREIEAVSWHWRFLLIIILARQLNARESGLSTINPKTQQKTRFQPRRSSNCVWPRIGEPT